MMWIMMPPGPRLPYLAQTALLWTRPQESTRRWHRRYGDTFTARAAPMGTIVYLADPADLRTVFAGDPRTYHAGEANSLMRGVLGDSSVLLVDEDEHRERRRQMLPPFHREAVRRQAELMAEIADADVARWPIGAELPISRRMSAITLEVILRIVIGADDPARLAALRRALPAVVDMNLFDVTSMMRPELLRYPPWFGVRRRRAEADRLLYREIADRRTDPDLATRTDVLSMLVRDADMTDRQLRDQLMTLLLAGHETTATGLSWALERLTRHPDVLARAVAAADAGTAEGEEYLDAVVRETLRVRPVIHEVARTLTAPVRLGRLRPPGRGDGAADHRAGARGGVGLSRPAAVRPGPDARQPADPDHLAAVRRGRTAVPGGDVRAGRDAGGAPHGAATGHAGRHGRAGRGGSGQARDPGAGPRCAGHGDRPPTGAVSCRRAGTRGPGPVAVARPGPTR
jgi:cytochrome P450